MRVLLVEDDPGVRHFFEMVCADLPLSLRCAGTAREALKLMADDWPDLLITDLMLPGEHGLWLVDQVRRLGAAQGGNAPRTVIFTADTSAQTALAIQQARVWRVLRKPASVADIEACMHEAAQADDAAADSPAPAVQTPIGVDDDPVHIHFAGNRALFDAFANGARSRFPADLAEGQAALQRADAAALERLAHSLKTVLRMLGDQAGSLAAARLEDAAHGLGLKDGAHNGDRNAHELAALWAALATSLAAQVAVDPAAQS
ncbi:MAG TPA: response regulator [Burkholderiaceae bacterium]|nr:response regulator [Burkholderiaceae bacterium]